VADIRALITDIKRQASIRLGAANTSDQVEWVKNLYLGYCSDLNAAEVTATAFGGESHSLQFRGATPEELRMAAGLAYDELSALATGGRTQPAPGLKIDFSYRVTST